jgi:hypothetical protein
LTFDQNNPNPKNGLTFINVLKSHEFWNPILCREFQVEFYNEKREIWMRTEQLSSLKVYISLVLVNLQNDKFLESWIELLCSIYHSFKMLINRRHACEITWKKNCFKRSWNEWVMDGQNWSFKKNLNKNIDFHPFWDKQIVWTVCEWHSILWFNFGLQNAESIYLKGYD